MTGLMFLHGWGLGADTWSAWVPSLSDAPGIGPVLTLDAGYFGPERLAERLSTTAALAEVEGWIGIGHSLGFATLAGMNIPWRGLVGLGAFLHFCPTKSLSIGTPASVLNAMLNRLDEAPVDVLTRFTKRCGVATPTVAPPTALGLGRLRRDLTLLRDLDRAAPACPVLYLHARNDRIAPLALAEEAHARTSGSQLAVLDTGGHALPLTQEQATLARVRTFLHELQ